MPEIIMKWMSPFGPVFDKRTWHKAVVLVMGSILTPGKRTVSAALRVMGYSDRAGFSQYHQVLNRAVWSAHKLSQIMLKLLIEDMCPKGPVVIGIDEHIERRKGKHIKAKGIYRDGVRSSQSHFVKTSGLRWVSMMLLTPVSWAQRVWALPFMTVLAPSERYHQERGKQYKVLSDWARQMDKQVRRWLPDREIVVVGDGSYAVLDFLAACQGLANPVTVITRLRLDAALYEPAPPRPTGKAGRPRKKGARLPTLQTIADQKSTLWSRVTVAWYGGQARQIDFVSDTAVWYHNGKPPVPIRWVLVRDPHGVFETQALLCTNQTIDPSQIVEWFVLRWQLEVTFQETRAHLGVNTQRQWSDKAIARTTPILFGLFSWVTLVANQLPITTRQSAWYCKSVPTFADALATVRLFIWQNNFGISLFDPDIPKSKRDFYRCICDTLAYAA